MPCIEPVGNTTESSHIEIMCSKELKGQHIETVLAITTNSEGKIATTGEEGEICIWDSTGKPKGKISLDDDVESLCFSKKNPSIFYASVCARIDVYDLNHPEKSVHTFTVNQDNINQVLLDEKEEFLAACDDSGEVKIINLQENKVFKTLRKHNNICSSILFRPNRPWEIISAGFDSQVLRCEFSRAKCLQIINMQELVSDTAFPGYMLNIPFVHAIDLSPNAELFACGLENGQIHIFDACKKNLIPLCVLQSHTHRVTAVHFVQPVDYHKLLVSGGKDGKVIIWDLKQFSSGQVPEEITPKQIIDHGSEVNSVYSSVLDDKPCILVADQTASVKVYQL